MSIYIVLIQYFNFSVCPEKKSMPWFALAMHINSLITVTELEADIISFMDKI